MKPISTKLKFLFSMSLMLFIQGISLGQTTKITIKVSHTPRTRICAGSTVTLLGVATDNSGTVTSVNFYSNNTLLGTSFSKPHVYIWTSPAIGTNTITAVAMDNLGVSATSTGVLINIIPIPLATITASGPTTFCQGNRVTLMSSPSSTYIWKNNGTIVGTSKNFVANSTGNYTLTVENRGGCKDSSSIVSVKVNPLPLATITAFGNTSFCQGNSVLLTSNSSSSYLWTLNGTVVGTSISYPATVSGNYRVTVTDTNNCSKRSAAIAVKVNPLPIPTITTTGSTTICQGKSITLISNYANAYSWLENGSVVGTARTFLATSSGAYTVSQTTLNGCTSTSAITTVSVIGLVPVSVSITPSATSVCTGSSVSFTAAGVNGGSNPAYTWYVNNLPQSNGSGFTYTPSNGDLVKVTLTASGTCLTGNPARSNVEDIRVNTFKHPIISVNPSSNPTCSSTGVVYTALTLYAGTAPWFNWFVNGNLMSGNAATFNYTPSNNDIIQATVTASGTVPNCLATNTATSAGLSAIVNGIISTSLVISPSSNPACPGDTVIFTSTATGTGAAPIYNWYVNGSLQAATTPSFLLVPTNGAVVAATMTPGGNGTSCIVGGTASSTGVTLTLNSNVSPSANILANSTTFCAGTFSTFSVSGSNLGTLPFYIWYVNNQIQSNGNVFSYIPQNGDTVSVIANAGGLLPNCLLTSSFTTSGLNIIFTPSPISSLSLLPSSPSVCTGSSINISATGSNLGSLPIISWIVNNVPQSISGAVFNYIPSNNDQVIAAAIPSGNLPACLSPTTITSSPSVMTVNNLTLPTASISIASDTVCMGTSAMFSLTYSNTGSAPGITWYINNTGVELGGINYSYSPSNGDQVMAILTPGIVDQPACLTTNTINSNVITLTLSPCLPPYVASITGPTFVSTGTSNNVYSVPNVSGNSYLWTVPSGANIVSGQGTNSITVAIDTIFNDVIGLTETNAYGSDIVVLNVQVYQDTVQAGIINQLLDSDINVFPNPTSNTFDVQLNNAFGTPLISVTDVNGVAVIPEQTQTNNLGASLPSGHYVITIRTEGGIRHKSLVKIQ